MIATRARILLACFLGAGAAGCAPHGAPTVITAKIVDAIKADEVNWNADYRSGDPAKVAAHYAPNAKMMMAGQALVVGAPAVKAILEAAYQDPHFGVTFASDHVDVAKSGDLAVARGTFRETKSDPKTHQPVTAGGYYVTLYKPQPDGKWRAVWDILTPGPPDGGAARGGEP